MSDDGEPGEADAYRPVLSLEERAEVRLARLRQEGDAMGYEATAGALAAVLDELEAAADRASRAAYAVTELEERLEEGHGPELAAGLTAACGRLAAAEQWLCTVRRRRCELEAALDRLEVARVHAARLRRR